MPQTMKFQLYMTMLCCAHVRCDLYSSVEDLQLAVRAVEELQWKIGEHIRTETKILDLLLKRTTEMEASVREYLEDPGHRLSHPVNAFLFTQKAVLEWDKLVDFRFGTSLLRYKLPTYEDLQGTVTAIRRLQDTYGLGAADIAAGHLYGLKSPLLSAYDCFTIGYLSYVAEDYRIAHEWLTVANRTLTHEKTPTIDIGQVSEYLELSEIEVEEEEWLEDDEDEDDGQDDDDDDDEDEDEDDEELDGKQILQRYKALCRGEDIMVYGFIKYNC